MPTITKSCKFLFKALVFQVAHFVIDRMSYIKSISWLGNVRKNISKCFQRTTDYKFLVSQTYCVQFECRKIEHRKLVCLSIHFSRNTKCVHTISSIISCTATHNLPICSNQRNISILPPYVRNSVDSVWGLYINQMQTQVQIAVEKMCISPSSSW